ncbi:hydrogenase small subunit [Methanosarcina mazei]|uniref:Hydrogenase small subunit n=6 Tax=Methanosarcina mazei TaxID=2209 RepID=A0A0F8FNV7_METMZ|nr:hydrogenase small subunit [Methanosarcina mazei]AGF97553.1 Methanophenazine hydrogenase small subunit precursor [Methanosarcina mazei Tuc01]AKB41458.1 Methanophenazine hydrogenase small subunit precursor [Methanosarcina mazei WWM610]AKB62373.1 Methanophenazine hydrogenase small subunit precursor [Methanosarcina mazei SarPi]AKB65710.1 Methanophenazine hydrogenase small subunit precursor [Methanosarcina mazei S-6]AKB71821.1 Methanophenazine hydrogenase small subunit precursor [Methanosarcina 
MVEDSVLEKFRNLDFMKMDRRTFIKAVGVLGASLFLQTYKNDMAKALAELPETKVVWLHGVMDSGCTISMLDGENPDIVEFLQLFNLNLMFQEVLMMQQGIFVDGELANTSELNSEILLEEILEHERGYILISEGAVANGPDGTGKYMMIGGVPYKEIYGKAARNASVIVAIGQCATHSGVNAAESEIDALLDHRGIAFTLQDPSKGIVDLLGIDTPVININGCPAHPDWVFLTIGAIALGKIRVPDDLPEVLDRWHRPKVFFPPDHTVHDNCPRRGYYDRGEFETTVGGPKCLWKLGCKGPYSHADCATRHWNGHLTFCPQAGSPCIGCVQPGFPDSTRPFFVEIEDAGIVGTNLDTIAGVAIGAGLLAAGAHVLRRTVFKKPEEKEGTSGENVPEETGGRE